MRRILYIPFVCASWLAAAVLAADPPDADLQRVEFLVHSGAPDLALRLMSDLQPDVSTPREWMEWERVRFAIYREQADWDALERRLTTLPLELPTHYLHTLSTQAIEALLGAGRGQPSRRYLRELLWTGSRDSRQLSHWRRLIIRSYLYTDQLHDAQTAMSRYQREFLPSDRGWSELYGRVLLQAGHPERAAAHLATVQTAEGRFLRMLSRLRARADDPEAALRQARSLQQDLPAQSPLHSSLWAVIAEAALLANDPRTHVAALEQLHRKRPDSFIKGLFSFEAAQLWHAYIRYGEELGNAANLLVGDDAPWLEAAESLHRRDPVKARSIYAMLAERASEASARGAHHIRLFASLKAHALTDTAVALYTDKQRFPQSAAVPGVIRYELVNLALSRRDIALAAEMALELEENFAPGDQRDWILKRARLAIYSGRSELGARLLTQLLESQTDLSKEFISRFLQPVFDLQAIGQDRAAYRLLNEAYQRTAGAEQKREILFWMGDSLRSAGEYEQAAELYFRSALFAGDGQDMWGQTARYRAAETLTDAGLVEDARRVYRSLLEVTTNPKRRAVLERALEQLWLRQPATTDRR